MVYYIAVDIGGSQIRAARFRAEEIKPKKIFRQPTQPDRIRPEEYFTGFIRRVWLDQGPMDAIGFASPGLLKLTRSDGIKAPYILQSVNFSLIDYLHHKFGAPIYLDTDADLATIVDRKIAYRTRKNWVLSIAEANNRFARN